MLITLKNYIPGFPVVSFKFSQPERYRHPSGSGGTVSGVPIERLIADIVAQNDTACAPTAHASVCRLHSDCTTETLARADTPAHINITEGPLLIPVFSLRSAQTCDSSTLTSSPAVQFGLIQLTVTRLGRQEAEAGFEERRIALRLKQGTAQLKMESSEMKPVL